MASGTSGGHSSRAISTVGLADQNVQIGSAPAAAARRGAATNYHGNVPRQTEQVGLHRQPTEPIIG
jgi:hypothetical protein